ncbi:beta-ketoacyl synthase [Nocardia sp. CS682]|uniref:beta-ketoacyl synthase n=1 Tax=Nocardia sp. CS682 TaxID=1047172 RepID=UPI001074F620|nr:beta-ketoacyl synthase [Nocardia sp. CS682]QBS45024.1 beta-ketoacyl synthase [Nocardia sp. CS682]
MTVLEFDGIAFDPVGGGPAGGDDGARTPRSLRNEPPQEDSAVGELEPVAGATATESHPTSTAMPDRTAAAADRRIAESTQAVDSARVPNPLSEIRTGVVTAHRAALAAQVALQRAVWQRTLRPAALGAITSAGSAVLDAEPIVIASESAFKPLARSRRAGLDAAALLRLTEGDVVGVFGTDHQRPGVTSVARLATAGPLVLTEVTTIELRGGSGGKGRVVARFDGNVRAAAVQAAEVFALFTGLPLCLSGSTLAAQVGGSPAGLSTGTVQLVVTELDLIPRPHVTATASISGTQEDLQVTVTAVEPAGTGVGPGETASGVLLNEFHMTHLSRGDQSIAMGPEFAAYTGVRATRLPSGGLLLVDRVREFDGARGRLDSAAYRTEYDSPADSWYYGDTANESMPHFVYMETSLQAALLMGYYAGPTLTQPGVTLSLRNLGGTATVLRQIDLRDKTIEQASRLLSTTILPGSSLQTFDYTLSVDGEPFYTGETMFGYFSDEALANQTGLDAGQSAPTWLDEHPDAPTRIIDVATRRADSHAQLCARRTLALIAHIDVVDGGGKYQAGYLHSLRAIDPSDWCFDRHFHLDPVIPGSLGVESVIHAVQEWLLDAGFADELSDPVFRIPAGIPFSWRYRGQFLPTDGTVELEAHIKEVRRTAHGVTVIVDGSLWKPGLRIYELIDLAVELSEREDGR